MKAGFVLFVSLGCTLACAQPHTEAPANTEAPTKTQEPSARPPTTCRTDKLDLLLSAPHDPPTKAELTAACDDPVPVLVRYAKDTSLRGLVRLRAIEALGKLGGSPAVELLSDRATASSDLASIRRAALSALKSATTDAKTREPIGIQALSDTDPHVRVAAVRLLHGSKAAAVRSELERAKARETEAFVVTEIERELAR